MRRIVLIWGIVCLSVGALWARPNVPDPMLPPRLVNDYAGIFTAEQRKGLEDSLVAFDRATSTQIVVLTVDQLQGYDPAQYATEVLQSWGVGRKGKDNGVVLLLKPRNQYGKGEVFIAVGYGLEGVLTDLTAGRIIDRDMLFDLSRGDYYAAVRKGTESIRQVVRGEYTAEDDDHEEIDWIGAIISIGALAWVIYLVRKSYKNGGNNSSGGGSGNNTRRRTIIYPPIGGFGGGGRSRGGGIGGFGGFGGGRGGGGGAGRSF